MSRRLRTAKNLRVRVTEDGTLRAAVSSSSGEFELTLDVLEMLRLLNSGKSDPRLVAKELKAQLQACAKSSPSAEEISGLVEDLMSAGVVVAEGGQRDSVHGLEDGFGDAWIQWAMLADAPRTRKYCEAIAAVVNKESVVVDVGAGTGVLTAAALRAGAKRVVAIEETGSARLIEPLLGRLGLASPKRFSVVHGNSGDANIPDTVTLVVSELFGNDPFSEGVLPTLSELSERLHSRSTVRFLPESVEVFAELIDLRSGPLLHRAKALVDSRELEAKGANIYDSFLGAARSVLDFSSLSFAHALSPSEFTSASSSVSLGSVSLSPPPRPSAKILTGRKTLKSEADARVPLVMLWFRVVLAPGLTLSSHPGAADSSEHWSPILVPLCTLVKSQAKLTIAHSLSENHDRMLVQVTQDNDVIGART